MILGLTIALLPALGSAGQPLLITKDPDARWTLISLPLAGAPVDPEGSQLLNSPVQVITARTKTRLLRSPADAHWARMAHERMHMEFHSKSENVYCPNPPTLPIYVEKTTLEL